MISLILGRREKEFKCPGEDRRKRGLARFGKPQPGLVIFVGFTWIISKGTQAKTLAGRKDVTFTSYWG